MTDGLQAPGFGPCAPACGVRASGVRLPVCGLRLLACALLLALLVPCLAGRALAEPRFAASSGLRCGRCHTSPLGGGKRSAYGALYAMSQLRMGGADPAQGLPGAGEGEEGTWRLAALATGEVTSWLAVGADLRLANRTTLGDEPDNSFDNSGGQLYLELRPWPERLLIYLDAGLSGDGLLVREAWGMVLGPWSTYLRGGRILPPYGLRLQDDAVLTRLVTGAGFANPDMGLEMGLDGGWWMAAVALTNGSFTAQDSDSFKALWALVELSPGPVRLGLSGAYNPSEEGCRTMGGLHAAVSWGRLLLQGEADFVAQRPADRTRWSYQVAGMVELHLSILKGLEVLAGYEIHDADLELTQDRRQRLRLGLILHPLPLVEARVGYTVKQAETPLPLDSADLLEVVLHVYL